MDIESTLSGHNLAFLEALYEAYQRDPNSVDPEWWPVLQDLGRRSEPTPSTPAAETAAPEPAAAASVPRRDVQEVEQFTLQSRVNKLIESYRLHGHMAATVDPLGRPRKATTPALDPAYFGLTDEHMDRSFDPGLLMPGGNATLRQLRSVTDAYLRVSSGLSLDDGFSSETFVHEVGHSQGRYHVFCNGQEGGPDPSYPTYPDEGQTHGEIHDWGFGVINCKLYPPTVHKDYMTYCHPVWASTWGWNKVYPIIQALSKWDDAGAPKPDDPITNNGSILVGSIYPDGKETWISVPGAVNPEDISGVHSVEFTIDGKVVHQPAALLTQPEGDVVLVVTQLPERWDAVTQMHHLAGPKRIAVPVAKVDQHHQRKLKAAD